MDEVSRSIGELEGRVGAVESGVDRLASKVDALGDKLDQVLQNQATQRGARRATIAGISAGGGLIGAVVTWAIAVWSGKP